jgi:hypothetical protein
MLNKNARVIIPLALVFWLLAIVVFRTDTPPFVEIAFALIFVLTVLGAVFYLIADMGWSPLAARYRSTGSFTGTWLLGATVHMSRVSVHHPQYARNVMRFIFMLRIGTSDHGLHLSTLLSRVPILGRLFPALHIPWSAVTKASTFEPPGWVRPPSEPGAVLQIAYDPNYTGTFAELEIGQPPVFLQLPLNILGVFASRLGLSHQTTIQSNTGK